MNSLLWYDWWQEWYKWWGDSISVLFNLRGPLNEASLKCILEQFDGANKDTLVRNLVQHLEISGLKIDHSWVDERRDVGLGNYVEKALARQLTDDEAFKVSILSKLYSDSLRPTDDFGAS